MKNRSVAMLFAACALVLGLQRSGDSGAAAPALPKRPNIIYILADDMGYSDIGVFGSEIPTPNLDRLARSGMMLTDFHTSMTCSPTRAMFMAGMDHHRAGLGVMGAPSRDDQKGQPGYEGHLNFRVASLAELMSEVGYNTYMVGKWHLGSRKEIGPHARGFKRVFASLDGAAHLGSRTWSGPQQARFFDGDEHVNVGDDWYSTRDYTKKLIGYIEQDRAEGKPFFAWAAYTAPHWPIQAPRESIARFRGKYDAGYEALYASRLARQKQLGLVAADAKPIDDARFKPRWSELSAEEKAQAARRMEVYAAMVSDLDVYVGELLAYLERIGELDNTFIFFSSDNGAEPGARESRNEYYDQRVENLGSENSYVMYGPNWANASSTPWNRNKFTAFEGGTRVPAFAWYPKRIPAGTRSPATTTIMDLLPTFLELAGTKHPGRRWHGKAVLEPQGRSLLPLLHGEATAAHPAGTLFGWELFGHRAVRVGDWKLVWDQALPAEARRWALYNLGTDPFEQNDVSGANPDKVRQLLSLWERYDEENGVIY